MNHSWEDDVAKPNALAPRLATLEQQIAALTKERDHARANMEAVAYRIKEGFFSRPGYDKADILVELETLWPKTPQAPAE